MVAGVVEVVTGLPTRNTRQSVANAANKRSVKGVRALRRHLPAALPTYFVRLRAGTRTYATRRKRTRRHSRAAFWENARYSDRAALGGSIARLTPDADTEGGSRRMESARLALLLLNTHGTPQ